MRTKEISSRLRFVAQVAAVAILASASAACSNASRFGLPMFTGSTNASASAQPGGVQPLPPGALGGSASGGQLTPNPGARVAPMAGPSTVARADLPPLAPAAGYPASPGYPVTASTYPAPAQPGYSTPPQPSYSAPPAAPANYTVPTYTAPGVGAPAASTPMASTPLSTPAPPQRPSIAAPVPPANQPAPVAVASAGGRVVTVAPGQTLYSIARANGVSVAELMQANGISNASRVQAGAQLRIPGPPGAGAPVQVANNNQPVNGSLGSIPGSTRTDVVPTPIATQPVRVPVQPTPTIVANNPPVQPPTIAQTPPSAPVTPIATQPSTPPSTSGTEFRWPVNGRMISNFGVKPDGERNDGINLAVPEGTSIKATEAGTVIYAGNEIAGYGNLILVRHAGGWVSAYAHAKDIMVERGQTVARGQTIAVVGATGSVSQPQLHFELRQGSTPVNPLDHLSGG